MTGRAIFSSLLINVKLYPRVCSQLLCPISFQSIQTDNGFRSQCKHLYFTAYGSMRIASMVHVGYRRKMRLVSAGPPVAEWKSSFTHSLPPQDLILFLCLITLVVADDIYYGCSLFLSQKLSIQEKMSHLLHLWLLNSQCWKLNSVDHLLAKRKWNEKLTYLPSAMCSMLTTLNTHCLFRATIFKPRFFITYRMHSKSRPHNSVGLKCGKFYKSFHDIKLSLKHFMNSTRCHQTFSVANS